MTEKVFFKNSKGLTLCGILEEPHPEKKYAVIMVHGYSTQKNNSKNVRLAKAFESLKLNSLRIDLDGCGESEGDFAEQTYSSMADDILSAIAYLKTREYSEFSLFGSSAGGLASMIVALQQPIKKIGLVAPVFDYPSQAIRTLGKEEIARWKKEGFRIRTNHRGISSRINYTFYNDSQQHVMHGKVKNITCPLLIVHGDKDEDVLIEGSRKIIQEMPNAKLIEMEGADHFFENPGEKDKVAQYFIDWFKEK